MAATTFHCFPRLPTELKLEIWSQFLHDEAERRTLYVDEKTLRVVPTKNLCSPILSVDVISRKAAQKFYGAQLSVLGFVGNGEKPSIGQRWSYRAMDAALEGIRDEACTTHGVIYLDPKLDTFFLFPWHMVVSKMLKAKTVRTRTRLFGTRKQHCMISVALTDDVRSAVQRVTTTEEALFVISSLSLNAVPLRQRPVWEIFKNARFFLHFAFSDPTGRPLLRGNVCTATGRIGWRLHCLKIEAANYLGRRVGPGIVNPPALASIFASVYPDLEERRRQWSAVEWSYPEGLGDYAPDWMKD